MLAIEFKRLSGVPGMMAAENAVIKVNIKAVIRLNPMGVKMLKAW